MPPSLIQRMADSLCEAVCPRPDSSSTSSSMDCTPSSMVVTPCCASRLTVASSIQSGRVDMRTDLMSPDASIPCRGLRRLSWSTAGSAVKVPPKKATSSGRSPAVRCQIPIFARISSAVGKLPEEPEIVRWSQNTQVWGQPWWLIKNGTVTFFKLLVQPLRPAVPRLGLRQPVGTSFLNDPDLLQQPCLPSARET